MVLVGVGPLLLVFPWPCCSTSHLLTVLWCWRGPGQADGGLSHLQGSSGKLRRSFSQPRKAKHMLGMGLSSSDGKAAMAALCTVVPHIWVQLPAATHIWAQRPTMLR